MRAEAGVEAARRRRAPRSRRGRLRAVRLSRKAALWSVTGCLAAILAAGVLFAGSPERIPEGVVLAGVDVGGLTAAEAERTLATRAREAARVPVVFTAGDERFALTPERLDVRVDWGAAVQEALAQGDGPVPLRGLERLKVRLFGVDLEPHAEVYEPALAHHLGRMAQRVDVAARDAALVLRGLRPVTVPAEAGRELDRRAAAATVVAALAAFSREPVALPVVVDEPAVTGADLAPAAADVRTALSAPVRFGYRDAHWRIAPPQLATMLVLPRDGATELRVGGPGAREYFAELNRGLVRRPRSASFELRADGSVKLVAARAGRALDEAATSDALLAAALSATARSGELAVRSVAPSLTTAEARGLGIDRVLSRYVTYYSGSSVRIRNLQLAVDALHGTIVRPDEEFSFNDAVGPRTEARGYGPAPVILNGKYEDGIGGGVSQVATTVFNAAWEAGLRISARTAHALYIDRYQLGRDATVNFPDVDLRFVNDTDHAIYVRGGYDESGISITLLGGKTGRRVVSVPGELRVVAPPREQREPDPNLYVGQRVVEDAGAPQRSVTVVRTVYVGNEVLRQETWTTTYRSEPKIVRVGTRARPAPKPPAATTTTGTTTATGTTTGKD